MTTSLSGPGNSSSHGNRTSLYHNYSRKIWQGIKFGSLAVYSTTAKLKSAKISYSHIYVWRSRTEPLNLNPPNILAIAILGSTAKFNSCQYFRAIRYNIIIPAILYQKLNIGMEFSLRKFLLLSQ